MKKIKTTLRGRALLEDREFNKGTAYTVEERKSLGLEGLIPMQVSTLEQQANRRYLNFKAQPNELSKFTFLNALQNRNETLFYRLVSDHLSEMVPLIYTPTVASVCLQYSQLYKEQRGLYISYPLLDRMDALFSNYSSKEVDVIVVTDGERILGLGDLGVGGMAISVGKLSLYSLFGGINPARTLPILLDVGTNNKELLEDPLYIGWRNERIRGREYDLFIEAFVTAVIKHFPKALLQWEDFAKPNALPLLKKYQKRLCSFNDDIQGTAAVTLAAAYSAIRKSGTKLKEQRIAILGGGSAGVGICNQFVEAICAEGGIEEEEARRLFYVVDRHGLMVQGDSRLDETQKPFAQPLRAVAKWKKSSANGISLLDVVNHAHPTILIGVSTSGGAFTEEIVRGMAKHTRHPIIFPLSNPTANSEAHPADLIKWTNGLGIIATGSPFDPIPFEGKIYPIAQCNNVYIFPGVGLGLIATRAKVASPKAFITAARILSQHSPMIENPHAPLFPTLDQLREVTKKIGVGVAQVVFEEGHAGISAPRSLEKLIEETMWSPEYPIYVPA